MRFLNKWIVLFIQPLWMRFLKAWENVIEHNLLHTTIPKLIWNIFSCVSEVYEKATVALAISTLFPPFSIIIITVNLISIVFGICSWNIVVILQRNWYLTYGVTHSIKAENKMFVILHSTFSNPFSSMKLVVFLFKCHLNMFTRAQLTICRHWFR